MWCHLHLYICLYVCNLDRAPEHIQGSKGIGMNVKIYNLFSGYLWGDPDVGKNQVSVLYGSGIEGGQKNMVLCVCVLVLTCGILFKSSIHSNI